ncbi:MAG: hypothetical protein WBD40_18705 [Tepidisphaeraceae bacterium]
MKRRFFILVGGAMAVFAFWVLLRTKAFYKEQHFRELEIQWNDEQIFVFVDVSTIYRSEALASVLSNGIVGDEETIVQNGMWVVQAHRGASTMQSYVEDLGQRRGPIGPVADVPHMFLGGGSRRVLRWSGTTFIDVDVELASRIGSSFQLLSDLLKREGWNRASGIEMGYRGDQSEMTRSFNLQNDTVRVSVRPGVLPQRVLTLQSGDSDAIEIVVGLARTSIKDSEFQRAKAQAAKTSSRRL